MARPQKAGLDYFPLDVDMDQDDKLYLIEAKHGLVGFAIVVRLFMLIYKEGYYRQYDEGREAFILAKRFSTDVNVINNVINNCVDEGLFNKKLYENYGILTSRGIQRRFMEVCKRRKEVAFIREYFLLNPQDYENIIFEELTPVNVDNNPGKCNTMHTETPQSKVKESTVKDSTKEHVGLAEPKQQKLQQLHNDYSPEFEQFWQVYPKSRRKEKKAAYRAWKARLKAGAKPEQLITAATLYAQECKGKDPRYIKLPKTFLGPDDHWEEYQELSNPDICSQLGLRQQYAHAHPVEDLELLAKRKSMVGNEGEDDP